MSPMGMLTAAVFETDQLNVLDETEKVSGWEYQCTTSRLRGRMPRIKRSMKYISSRTSAI